jgi:hypothetical protein
MGLVILLLLLASASAAPYITYWHNWASGDGVTHLTQCNLTHGWVEHVFGPGQPSIFTNTLNGTNKLTWFITPEGWNPPEFHANPVVQFGVWFQVRGHAYWRGRGVF